MTQEATPSSQRKCAEVQGDPYHKKILLCRFTFIQEPGRVYKIARYATAASAISVCHPPRTWTPERTHVMSHIKISAQVQATANPTAR